MTLALTRRWTFRVCMIPVSAVQTIDPITQDISPSFSHAHIQYIYKLTRPSNYDLYQIRGKNSSV